MRDKVLILYNMPLEAPKNISDSAGKLKETRLTGVLEGPLNHIGRTQTDTLTNSCAKTASSAVVVADAVVDAVKPYKTRRHSSGNGVVVIAPVPVVAASAPRNPRGWKAR